MYVYVKGCAMLLENGIIFDISKVLVKIIIESMLRNMASVVAM